MTCQPVGPPTGRSPTSLSPTSPASAGGSPAVDVIVLSWNRAEDTIEAIRSCLAQEGVRRRIFVADQGSRPEEFARIEAAVGEHPDLYLHRIGRNIGVPGGRNLATAMGHAPYIVALDSDAVFADATVLARAVAEMAADPKLAAVGFRITDFSTGRDDLAAWDYPAGRGAGERFAATRFAGAGHCIRRTAFEAAGGYDPRLFFGGEALDLGYRLVNTGGRIDYVPSLEVRHKRTPGHWMRGRYRLAVRNHLYTMFKFGWPPSRLGLAALAFLLRGLRNGLLHEAVIACWQAGRLCAAYARSREDKAWYRLTPQAQAYIEAHEASRTESLARRVLRQLRRMPQQG